MTGRLAGKAAMITGAAQGIGAAIAAAFVAEGARVIVTDIDGPGVEVTAGRFGRGRAFACRHDVTSDEDWATAVSLARDKLGGLSVLVNNAGIVVMGSVEDVTLHEWRRAMTVNADGAFLGCRHALPLLRESQPGAIVNMSSASALVASHNLAAYNASKAALWMLTKSVALHCARNGWNIRCNSVHPTFIRTPLLDDIAPGGDRAETLAKLTRQIPLRRLGEAADVAAACVYLASDESSMMTGAELKLDGGLTAQ